MHCSPRKIKRVVERVGGRMVSATVGGKHYRVVWTHTGHTFLAIFCISPGDGMWEKVKFRDLMGDLKKAGLVE